jgi:hypothetical protein
MALNPINPVLRSMRYDAVSPAKVSLSVQPGEVLEVSDDIAGQLVAQSQQFKLAPAPAPRRGRPPKVDVVAEVEGD